MTTTEMVARDGETAAHGADLAGPALYDTMDKNKLAAVKKKMKGLDDPEVLMALELAQSLGLNIWTNEFYAAKGNGGELLVMVGRDGLLRKAEEFPDYCGYDCGVLYEKDHFEKVDPDPDGKTMRARAGVSHRPAHPKDRGACLGAWAVAERRGRPVRYFFAPFEEYCPASPHAKSSWARNPSIMIEKVPISVVHRTLCNLSGVYLEEEVAKLLESVPGAEPVDVDAMRSMVYELDVPIEVRDALWQGISDLNTLTPNSWGPATIQMKLMGRDEEAVRRELQILEDDCRRAAAARTGRPVDAAATVTEDGEPPIEDAEPVEEGDPDAPLRGEPEPEDAEPVLTAEQVEQLELIDGNLSDLRNAIADVEEGSDEWEALEAQIAENEARRDSITG